MHEGVNDKLHTKKKVNETSEAPRKCEAEIPSLFFKEPHALSEVRYHPQRVTKCLLFIKCAILKKYLPIGSMIMACPWNDDA